MKKLAMVALMTMVYFLLYGQEKKDSIVLKQVNAKNINKAKSIARPLQLTSDKENAILLRNTGRVLTIVGIGIAGAGFITYGITSNRKYPNSLQGAIDHWGDIVGGFGLGCVGIVITAVGIPIWIIGANRKANAEIAFKKYDLRTTNLTTVEIGLTVRF